MLLEFKCSNHKAIKGEVVLSMVAGSEQIYFDRLIPFSKWKFLPCAVIFGANGSGKSCLLDAVSFLRDAVVKGASWESEWNLRQTPHRASDSDAPSKYRIQFVEDGVRYAYGLSVLGDKIFEEYLSAFPGGRRVRIFTRDGMSVKTGKRYEKTFAPFVETMRGGRPFLSIAARDGKAKAVTEAYRFFSEDLVVTDPFSEVLESERLSKMLCDENLKSVVLGLLRDFGTGIKGVEAHEYNPRRVIVSYDSFDMDFEKESDGVRRIVSLAFLIADAERGDKTLFVDNLESTIHELVTTEIVKRFQRKKEDAAQLIFTGYSPRILDMDFRKDQIYFTSLKEDRSVDLYSLLEIRDVREHESFSNHYLRGSYGAVPDICKQVLNNL